MSLQEYAKEHQKAFRTAFDFLTSHFPPRTELSWWDQLAKDADAASIAAGENILANKLLAAVMDYLEFEWRKRKDG